MKSSYSLKQDNVIVCRVTLFGPPADGIGLITYIWTHPSHRSVGLARKLMSQVTQDADADGIELWLSVQPDSEEDYDWLFDWYEDLGFLRVMAGDPTCVRAPARV